MSSSPQCGDGAPAAERDPSVRLYRRQSLATLACGVAHDLNNTMACVLGNNNILLKSMPADAPLAENSRQIDEAAKLAVGLARDLAYFAGRMKVEAAAFDLSALVSALAAEGARRARQNVRIRIESPQEGIAIRADPDQVRLAATSLLNNALDFMPAAGGAVTIACGKKRCGKEDFADAYFREELPVGPYAYVEVADTGCGIAPDVLERIFDPFFTTKLRGRGMGLPVAIGIVAAHRGAITVSTLPGLGSRFRMWLPG